MKHFLKIKRTIIRNIEEEDMLYVEFLLRNGMVIAKHGNDFINMVTGEVLEPLFDEFTDELIGFIY